MKRADTLPLTCSESIRTMENVKPVAPFWPVSFMKGLFHSEQHGCTLGSELPTGLRAFVQPSSVQVRI